MSLADAQIAGICLAGGYQLATRNVSGFSTTAGLTTVNPFDRWPGWTVRLEPSAIPRPVAHVGVDEEDTGHDA